MNAIIIPLFFFLLLYVFNQYKKIEWRQAFIICSLLTGGILVILTEFLSNVMQFTFNYLFSGWMICTLLVVAYLLKYKPIEKDKFNKTLKSIYKTIKNNKLSFFMIFFILINTFALALISPPNTFDSMTYHMSRVAH